MKRVKFTCTELYTSNLCLGGDSFCKKQSLDYSFEILDAFFENGGNFIDTANIYGKCYAEETNINEIHIGKWLTITGCRSDVIIGTKGGHPPLEDMNIGRLSETELRKDINESLNALCTDYVDIYWLHRDDRSFPVSEIAEALNKFIKEGKTKYIGCSNWAPDRIEEFQQYAKKNGLCGFAANQSKWSYADVNKDKIEDKTLYCFDKKAYDYHLKTGLPVVAYSSQAKGYFAKLESNTENKGGYFPIYDSPENFEKFKKTNTLAKKYGVSANAIALAYLTHRPFLTIPILGYSSKAQLLDSLSASELVLSKEDLYYLGD